MQSHRGGRESPLRAFSAVITRLTPFDASDNLVYMSEPARSAPEQKLYEAVRDAEQRLAAARAKRDAYIRGKGKASHTVADLARIFGMSRVALYKILNATEPPAAPERQPQKGGKR